MRLRRRRQVDADRPAALRHEADPRRPARAHRGRLAPPRLRVRRPRAAHRRPARRARAGDHDRRRLSLLRHSEAAVPARRCAGTRPVHAQHGHGRLDGRARDRARGRASGRRRADQTPRVHPLDPPRAARRRRGQQDGSRRLVAGAVRRDRCAARRAHGWKRRRPSRRRPAEKLGIARPVRDPDLGAAGRQRRRPLRAHAVVRRPGAPRASRDGGDRLRPRSRQPALPRAVGDPADLGRASRLPRLRRPDRRRRLECRRRGRRPAGRREDAGRGRGDDRRAARGRDPADVGDDPARRRSRRLARRHARRSRRAAGRGAGTRGACLLDERPAARAAGAAGRKADDALRAGDRGRARLAD